MKRILWIKVVLALTLSVSPALAWGTNLSSSAPTKGAQILDASAYVKLPPDYTPVLREISDSLKPSPRPWVPWVVSVSTTLLSVAAGYLVSRWSTQRQEANKKTLIKALLRDEITLRWRPIIFADLDGILVGNNKLHDLERLASVEMAPSDMFVVNSVGESFADFSYLGDATLLSKVIHGSVLFRDLIDLRNIVRKVLEPNHKSPSRSSSVAPNAARIDRLWDKLRHTVNEANSRFDDILSGIS